MSNVIPGTNYIASEGVKSAFKEYLDEKHNRENMKKHEQAVTEVKQVAKEKVTKPKVAKQPKTNNKKVAALNLFEANKDKGNGEIAQLISKELEITYANAYYYVTRVFKR